MTAQLVETVPFRTNANVRAPEPLGSQTLYEPGGHNRCGGSGHIRKIGKNLFIATRTEGDTTPAETESVLEAVSLLD